MKDNDKFQLMLFILLVFLGFAWAVIVPQMCHGAFPLIDETVVVECEFQDDPQVAIETAIEKALEVLVEKGFKEFFFEGYGVCFKTKKIMVVITGKSKIEAKGGEANGNG